MSEASTRREDVPDVDAQEQERPVDEPPDDPIRDGLKHIPVDVPEADALEQAEEVPLDDDDRP